MSVFDRHTIAFSTDDVALTPKRASVIFDESWSPYVQATLEFPLPDVATLDDLDPRDGEIRVGLRLLQVFGDSPSISDFTALVAGDVSDATALWGGLRLSQITALYFVPWNSFGVRASTSRTLTLLLRDRNLNRKAETMTLELASLEAMLIDGGLVATTPLDYATTSVKTIVTAVLARHGEELAAGASDGTVMLTAAIQQPGQGDWDFLSPLLQTAGLRLWCTELGVWQLDPNPDTIPGSVRLAIGDRITEASDIISRNSEDIFDAVVVIYEWVDDLGVTQRAYDTAAEDDWTKLTTVHHPTRYPGTGAAANVLARAQGRGRQQDVSAVSDYMVAPGQAAVVVAANDDTSTGFVSRVEYSLPLGEMAIKTRGLTETPLGSWDLAAPTLVWTAVNPATTWNAYV